uniref:Uncharacterized protein orf67 n=1 Tax=Monomastix sp. (strain OKE-1) TaxID=141716 RepID=C0JWJ0_MONSK|nr:hypothetical protein MoOKC_p006 [Monomastix sp. OKE-1]ACK36931.1 unknown [Monomastix sp. OKE-1]
MLLISIFSLEKTSDRFLIVCLNLIYNLKGPEGQRPQGPKVFPLRGKGVSALTFQVINKAHPLETSGP